VPYNKTVIFDLPSTELYTDANERETVINSAGRMVSFEDGKRSFLEVDDADDDGLTYCIIFLYFVNG
jgi:hypothetical protein